MDPNGKRAKFPERGIQTSMKFITIHFVELTWSVPTQFKTGVRLGHSLRQGNVLVKAEVFFYDWLDLAFEERRMPAKQLYGKKQGHCLKTRSRGNGEPYRFAAVSI